MVVNFNLSTSIGDQTMIKRIQSWSEKLKALFC
jgi:hypothetical protein